MGLLVSPVVASVLPTALGTRIASFIVGEADRWEAGMALMRNARPQNWKTLLWKDKVDQTNIDRLNECQRNANKENISEQCTINIKPE
ncbi:DUF6118 family protein [Gluconacetobacter azotocaptans]|uniref:DUF6118 family protein n=1 Tax=Gluconacetobacter azotocaptans TaxID=142834 RepID=UPI002156E14E|nr:hypothetical protein AA13594_1796 [Gluconacetobacter azotocaptans DSM 13594]